MVYLVCAVIFLHLISLPIVTKISAKADTDAGTAKLYVKVAGITVFKKAFALEAIKRKLYDSLSSDEKEEKQEKSKKTKKFVKDLGLNIAKRIRVRDADLAAVIGTGDAAVDAVVAGSVRIAYKQLCAYYGLDCDGDIRPDYHGEILFFDFFGIFSICFADIIFAVCETIFRSIRIGKRRNYANVAR